MAEKATVAKTKSAPKAKSTTRKAPAKRKTAAKKPKSVVRSNVRSVENKAVAVERKVRRTARSAEKQLDAAEKATEKFAERAQDTAHTAVLATLGFYAKAYEQAQEQFDSLQKRLQARRKQAAKTYAELIKRGEKMESSAKSAVKDIDLSKLTDRKALEARLKAARERFNELRESASAKIAA
ncbi:MAG: hypothetical protein R3E54_11245 [Halioglobus sp.]